MNDNERFLAGLQRMDPKAGLRDALKPQSANKSTLRAALQPGRNSEMDKLRPSAPKPAPRAQIGIIAEQYDPTPAVRAAVREELNKQNLRQELSKKTVPTDDLRNALTGAIPAESTLFQEIAPVKEEIPVSTAHKRSILEKKLGVFSKPAATGISKSLGLTF